MLLIIDGVYVTANVTINSYVTINRVSVAYSCTYLEGDRILAPCAVWSVPVEVVRCE